jgi:hypothetical protein
MEEQLQTYTAFVGVSLIASGPISSLLPALKQHFDHDAGTPLLIFEDWSGRQVDFDLRGSLQQALARALPAPPRSGPGRPRLGVTSREVSLLPRHWQWLEQQPNGASAALRRLVDDARKHESDAQPSRQTREAIGRFLTAIAGNLPNYEEASRALYAVDREHFESLIRDWPGDIQAYLHNRAGEAFWTKA